MANTPGHTPNTTLKFRQNAVKLRQVLHEETAFWILSVLTERIFAGYWTPSLIGVHTDMEVKLPLNYR